ncbi:MAG: hypothetical protein IT494_02075 [Gammaproteobacteria bacterium]|nr:hypothetical protein [Gammaproteobacteria bacterium]
MNWSRIGVVAALAAEADAWHSARGDSALVVQSGIGAARAAVAAEALAQQQVSALLSFGTAGGLDPTLAPGTLLLPSRLIADDGVSLPIDAAWHAAALTRLSAQQVVTGSLCSRRQIVATAAAKTALADSTNACAVDMESAAIATVAVAHGLPFLAVRAVLDPASFTLPRPAQVALDETGALRTGRLALALLAAPHALPALWRLRSHFRAALATLRAAASLLRVA